MMRSIYLPLSIALMVALWVRWYYVCRVEAHACCAQTTAAATGSLNLFQDGKPVLTNLPDPVFELTKNGFNVKAGSERAFDQIAAYMAANPDKIALVTGLHNSSEKGKVAGFYENLGMARAAAFRSELIKRGLTEAEVMLIDSLVNDNPMKGYITVQTMSVDNMNTKGGEAQSFDNITFRDLTFESGSAKFAPTASLTAYVDSLLAYTVTNTGTVLKITGHTDDEGGDVGNMKLGQQRADAVKAYLVSKGIKTKIETASKGETEPLVPNDSEEHRKRNRRVNIQF